MKAHQHNYLTALLLGVTLMSPIVAVEKATDFSAEDLQAAIEAFGVPVKMAEKATTESAMIIEEEKRKSDKNYQDMLIVSDDFFTIEPL